MADYGFRNTILIVDDTPTNIDILRGILSSRFRVKAAIDGEKALTITSSGGPPDLILLDVMMPGIDGYEVCRRLKADERFQDLPVIFISALDRTEDKVRGFAVGGVDYITKPFQAEEVMARVETHLALRQLQQQREAQNARLQAEIVERKRVEAALERANNELEQRVEERTAELVASNVALRSERERLRAVTEAFPDPVFVLNESGICVDVYRPDLSLLPQDRETYIGTRPHDLLQPDQASLVQDTIHRTIASGKRQTIEYEIEYESGKYHFEGRSARMDLPRDKNPLVVWIARNVTEREDVRRTAQEKELLRIELAKEREISELKSRFASMASHEFRTPLTTILSSNGLLELYLKKFLPAEQLATLNKHIRRIETSVNHLVAVLNEVLVIGKAETGRMNFNPAPLDLDQFSRELVEEINLSTNAEQRVLFVSQGNAKEAVMDKSLLRQILTNLLSNGLKYSPNGEDVHFHLIRDKESVIFQVQDWGIGIPEEDQKRLFEPFHRATNVGTISGTGLGLSIALLSAEAHGGTITCTSQPGEGALFTVTLPIGDKT